jgi:hypothetical protein
MRIRRAFAHRACCAHPIPLCPMPLPGSMFRPALPRTPCSAPRETPPRPSQAAQVRRGAQMSTRMHEEWGFARACVRAQSGRTHRAGHEARQVLHRIRNNTLLHPAKRNKRESTRAQRATSADDASHNARASTRTRKSAPAQRQRTVPRCTANSPRRRSAASASPPWSPRPHQTALDRAATRPFVRRGATFSTYTHKRYHPRPQS